MKVMTPVVLLLALAACGPDVRHHQADASLRANFTLHRAAFQRLAALAEGDPQFGRVGAEWVEAAGLSPEAAQERMPAARWAEYRRLFREADVPEGMARLAGGTIVFWSSSEGMLDSGSLKGYAWSRTPLEPLVESLDDPRQLHVAPDRDQETRFVCLDREWYLVLQVG